MNANAPITLFYNMEDCFWRSISTQCLDFDHSAKAYCTGIEADKFNPVSVRNSMEHFDDTLNKVQAFFQKNKSPWSFCIPEEFCSKTVKNSLTAYMILVLI